ncbi:MAG: hypothetical protein ACHQEM_05670 [Chitinophagales bacterium]
MRLFFNSRQPFLQKALTTHSWCCPGDLQHEVSGMKKRKHWILNRNLSAAIAQGIFLMIVFTFSSGCFMHYYKTNTVHIVKADTLEKLVKEDKYFIIHFNNELYALSNVKVKDSAIEGSLDTVAMQHADYLHPKMPTHNRFPIQYQDDALTEVHLYASNLDTSTSPVRIPLKYLRRMDVYSLDRRSTNKSKVGSIIGVTLITAGTIALIVAIVEESNAQSAPPPTTTVSCSPQVYLLNDQKTVMEGTLYSGAIYASLERNDYLPLSVPSPAPEKLQVMVKGEKNEALMFNEVRLMEIAHPSNRKALLDRHGNVMLYGQPVAPFHASIGDREKNVMSEILAPDYRYYSFTNDGGGAHASDIVLDFKKPKGTASGKLLIRAKNSPWAYYLFSQYKSLYGEYYNALIRKKDSADSNKVLQCELDQYLPLLVSVRKDGEWKFMDYFPTPGNSGPRDLIMELDLSDQKDADHVEVRLQTTYFFWDLDYAAMDFSKNDEYKLGTLNASRLFISGPGLEQKEVSFNSETHLSVSDTQQLNLEFQLGQRENADQLFSYFLVGKGYYHDDTKFSGKPNYTEISKFSGKGAFDQYSRKKMEELVKSLDNKDATELSARR